MFRVLLVYLLAVVTVGLRAMKADGQVPHSGSSSQGPSASAAAKQVLALDEARRLAMLHGDVAALDTILAEDATVYWGDGTADDKASTLALFRAARLRYSQFDYDSTRVRVYGGTAVVTGRARVRLESDGQGMSHSVRITRVYVHRAGHWQLVAVQTTRADPPDSR
jgi:ketosteroid isomerase-like protein